MIDTPTSSNVPDPAPAANDPFMTAEEAVEYLGLAKFCSQPLQAIRFLARQKRLRSIRLGKRLAFRRSWLEEFANRPLKRVYRPRSEKRSGTE